MDNQNIYDDLIDKATVEIDQHIEELHKKIRAYGSFNVIANSILRNQIRAIKEYDEFDKGIHSIVPEYVSLVCLKYPFSLGTREFTHLNEAAKDQYEINELALKIITKYSFLHQGKYRKKDTENNFSNLTHITQVLSSQELLVRNPTIELFHWDLLDEMYKNYNPYFKETLGFSVEEAIDLCMGIADIIGNQATLSIKRAKQQATQMYEEIITYKYRNKIPKNYYPPEYLNRFKSMNDSAIKEDFEKFSESYEIVVMGETFSFSTRDLSEKESIDKETVERFCQKLSLKFGEIDPDFKRPEIMHPLKDRPLIYHSGKFICPSTSLLDYSLDRLFASTLLKDGSKREKYKKHRHDYLLNKGVTYIKDILKANEAYTNLNYPGGEIDGLVFCDSNIFFIEAKGHIITDRAKKGYVDRMETHINDIVRASHNQAIKAYNYLYGKKDVKFTDKKGKKIVLDGSKYQNVHFISLTLEDFSAISCSLKINNSLGLFTRETFPWVVSLYDLRMICEHMEGPSYFIQYLHRRKEFFQYEKIIVNEEIDLLGYYLKRNLRFDDIIEKTYKISDYIYLESLSDEFNNYYLYEQGYIKKYHARMKHFSTQPIKSLVKALEECGLPFGKDVAVQVLEFGTKTKKELIEYINKLKKQFKKDGKGHDFRIGGDDVNNHSWMLSYWVGPNDEAFLEHFDYWIRNKFNDEPCNKYVAILDTSTTDYKISKIIHLQK